MGFVVALLGAPARNSGVRKDDTRVVLRDRPRHARMGGAPAPTVRAVGRCHIPAVPLPTDATEGSAD